MRPVLLTRSGHSCLSEGLENATEDSLFGDRAGVCKNPSGVTE